MSYDAWGNRCEEFDQHLEGQYEEFVSEHAPFEPEDLEEFWQYEKFVAGHEEFWDA